MLLNQCAREGFGCECILLRAVNAPVLLSGYPLEILRSPLSDRPPPSEEPASDGDRDLVDRSVRSLINSASLSSYTSASYCGDGGVGFRNTHTRAQRKATDWRRRRDVHKQQNYKVIQNENVRINGKNTAQMDGGLYDSSGKCVGSVVWIANVACKVVYVSIK